MALRGNMLKELAKPPFSDEFRFLVCGCSWKKDELGLIERVGKPSFPLPNPSHNASHQVLLHPADKGEEH